MTIELVAGDIKPNYLNELLKEIVEASIRIGRLLLPSPIPNRGVNVPRHDLVFGGCGVSTVFGESRTSVSGESKLIVGDGVTKVERLSRE